MKLKVSAEERLGRERALEEGYDRLWEKEAEQARGRLSTAERARFWILHRQFQGKDVPGLSRVVQAARFIWSRVRKGTA